MRVRHVIVFALGAAIAVPAFAAEPVRVIFDTDMYTDYDDIGAIAMLHAFADAGECEILAMGTCTWGKGNRSVAAVEVLNAYYGRPDIPVGGTDHGGIEGAGAAGFGLSEKYRKWVKHYETADAPKAVDVYRKALESAPDGSVTMVSVGFMSNMADLLRAHRELVARKVRIWVCMGCFYPSGKEFNSKNDAKASDFAFRNWPTPIIWTDFQYGRTCYAGRAVAELSSAGDNPVCEVFRKKLTPREKVVVGKSWDQLAGHPSWDETAVLIAVKGWEPYFNLEHGRFEMVGTEGDDRWVPDSSSRSGRVVEKLSKEQVGKIIDELMCRSPKR